MPQQMTFDEVVQDFMMRNPVNPATGQPTSHADAIGYIREHQHDPDIAAIPDLDGALGAASLRAATNQFFANMAGTLGTLPGKMSRMLAYETSPDSAIHRGAETMGSALSPETQQKVTA